MSIQTTNTVANMKMAPEIVSALEAVNLPEVQALIKELSNYNLAVCVPHMHRPDIDFDVLPENTVQVEENCRVSWVLREELELMKGHVPVAWRWVNNGIVEDMECIQTCTPNPKKGHRSGHL